MSTPKKAPQGWHLVDSQKPGIYVPENRTVVKEKSSRENIDRMHREFKALLQSSESKDK
jgi:hypothetical protein